MKKRELKMTLEFGDTTLITFLPIPSVVWDPVGKNFEVGVYFLKYFLTINFRK